MGPEGGRDGGQVVFAGTPEGLLARPTDQEPISYTAQFLRHTLKK
jgi:excinuclease UvrABC ATPase subunit